MSTTVLQIVEPVPAVQTSVRAVGLLRPLADPAAVVQAQNDTRAMVKAALKEGRDYGIVPGTDKPALYKPGAERCNLAFGLTPKFRVVEQEVDHDRDVKWVKRKKQWRNQFKGDREFTWLEETGMSFGIYRYVVECQLVHGESGAVVGECIGACSSMESKYVDRPRDSENTIVKMAQKRAYVGATLLALGLSDEFTQDTEDLAANGVITAPDDGTTGTGAQSTATSEPEAICPKCKGKMWDNRAKKTNPKAPDFKCRDKNCEGVYWSGEWPKTEASTPNGEQASTVITADTLLGFGPHANSTAKEVPLDFLRWATEDGRKLGDRTAEWQEVFRMELEHRTSEVKPPARSTRGTGMDPEHYKPASRPSGDDELPF